MTFGFKMVPRCAVLLLVTWDGFLVHAKKKPPLPPTLEKMVTLPSPYLETHSFKSE